MVDSLTFSLQLKNLVSVRISACGAHACTCLLWLKIRFLDSALKDHYLGRPGGPLGTCILNKMLSFPLTPALRLLL